MLTLTGQEKLAFKLHETVLFKFRKVVIYLKFISDCFLLNYYFIEHFVIFVFVRGSMSRQ